MVSPGARIGGAFHTDGGEPVHEAHALAVLGPYELFEDFNVDVDVELLGPHTSIEPTHRCCYRRRYKDDRQHAPVAGTSPCGLASTRETTEEGRENKL